MECPVIDGACSRCEIRVGAHAVRCGAGSCVVGLNGPAQAVIGKDIGSFQLQGPGVSGLGGELGRQGEGGGGGFLNVPGQPRGQTVEGIIASGFGKGQLVLSALMGETTICQAVWPGGEDRSVKTGADCICVKGHDEISAPEPQCSQGSAGGGDVGGVIAVGKGTG